MDENNNLKNEIGTNTLGRLAVRIGAATFEQVSECIKIQKEQTSKGISSRLGDILVEKKHLSPEQLDLLLTAQKKLTRIELPEKEHISTFGGYDLLNTIGSFADCDTYKARHRETGTLVTLRIMQPEIVDNHDIPQKLQRNVKRAILLRHNNIARIFSAGQETGRNYYALEYTEGVSLRQIIDKFAPLSPGLSIAVISETALALEHSHKQKVCHQQLRPSDILITHDGGVKVIGLGLAREPIRSMESLIRSAGRMPLYIAPEQVDLRENPDPRSDLFSLGAIFFHMLTGIPPFSGEAIADIILEIERHSIPCLPQNIHDACPELTGIINRLLAYNPEERFPDATSLLEALSPLPRNDIVIPG